MSSSAGRGAVLVAVAALLGFLILRGAAGNAQVPLSTVATAAPTAVVTPTPSDAVEVAPTAIVDTATARSNAEVRVLVANGTEVSGLAGRVTASLRNQGFNTRDPKNALAQATSAIYYRSGFAAEAQVVRNVLGRQTPIAPMPVPDPPIGEGIDLGSVDVLVLVGDDDLADS